MRIQRWTQGGGVWNPGSHNHEAFFHSHILLFPVQVQKTTGKQEFAFQDGWRIWTPIPPWNQNPDPSPGIVSFSRQMDKALIWSHLHTSELTQFPPRNHLIWRTRRRAYQKRDKSTPSGKVWKKTFWRIWIPFTPNVKSVHTDERKDLKNIPSCVLVIFSRLKTIIWWTECLDVLSPIRTWLSGVWSELERKLVRWHTVKRHSKKNASSPKRFAVEIIEPQARHIRISEIPSLKQLKLTDI